MMKLKLEINSTEMKNKLDEQLTNSSKKSRFTMRFVIILIIFCYCSSLMSVTLEVNSDGSTPFNLIQEAIDYAVNGDTILVHPSAYIENIDFLGKNLVVGSLYLTTGINSYINQTVIDGNQEGSVVKVISGEEIGTTICGFTIRNGSGNEIFEDSSLYGGGILLKDSALRIDNCKIRDNNTQLGGGLSCMNSTLELSATLVTANYAIFGGGIFARGDSNINFDPVYRCNIYLNYAGFGNEIQKTWDCPPIDVIVDTFTVNNPDSYFIRSTTTTGVPLYDVNLYSFNAKLVPVDSDLYVSVDGNDSNDGLSEDNPLASLNYAFSLIDANSSSPKTIYVSNGLYSSISGQHFPLSMRSYVSLKGESMENTILDTEHKSSHIIDQYNNYNTEYTIENLSLINSYDENTHCVSLVNNNIFDINVKLKNITISGNISSGFAAIFSSKVKLELYNICISNNHSPGIYYYNSTEESDTLKMTNIRVADNYQNPGESGVIPIILGGVGTQPITIIMQNVEVSDNIETSSDWPSSSNAILLGDNINLYLVNSTIGNNQSPGYGGSILFDGDNTSVTIINSIIYDNQPHQIYIDNYQSNSPCSLTVINSLIDGGQEEIQNPYSFNEVFWMDGNLDADPMWIYNGDWSYSLLDNSPCIDVGTLDLPNGIELPEYDLAGNPRVYGETIDMGCYEWQGTGSMNDELPIANYKLCNYPNPFNPETTIEFSLSTESELLITIYNIKGQLVKTLLKSNIKKGKHQITWTGKNESGIEVSSGIYYCRLKSDNMETIRKMILIK